MYGTISLKDMQNF